MGIRAVVLVLLACCATGCTTLRTVQGPPATVVGSLDAENAVVLTTIHGEQLRVANVQLKGDSLIGIRSTASRDRRFAVALDEIQSVGVARTNALATFGLIFATAAVTSLLAGFYILRAPGH